MQTTDLCCPALGLEALPQQTLLAFIEFDLAIKSAHDIFMIEDGANRLQRFFG
jgi:hypothetical protein